MFRLIFAYT